MRQLEVGAIAEVGDHEEEHDHHRPGVHEHLRRGEEVGLQHQEEGGEGGEVQDQRERREERVALRDDADRRAEGAAPAM